MKENFSNLKTQIEEAQMGKKLLRGKLIEKEEACCILESEVTNVKRKIDKVEARVRFMCSSTILDDTLNNQRSPNDKSSLDYN